MNYYFDPEVADAYDAENGPSRPILVDDVPFYVSLAKQTAARGQRVLELGCGTGRVTIPIARAGVEVVGLDSSPAMLEVARRKSEGLVGLTWVEADMADFTLDGKFGLICIPFRSFLLLLTVAEQKACLKRCLEHLVPGGRLALNIFNPDIVLMASWMSTRKDTWERRKIDERRELWSTRRFTTADQQVDETDEHLRLSDNGAIIRRVAQRLRLRYVFRYEMEHLLALAGFEVEALYGWFDGKPFRDDSQEMVWIARKPGR